MTLTEARRAFPWLGFAVYAYTPQAPVTLEIITPDQQTFTAHASTEEEALEMAFPQTEEPSHESVFD